MRRTKPQPKEPERTYFDRQHGCPVVKVFPGECRIAAPGEGLATVLGSCVAACVRNPRTGYGGMNHFLLAGTRRPEETGSTRYGLAAMDALIREVLREGGRADELEVKVFGGSAMGCATKIGRDNADFVLRYLQAAGIGVTAQDLGGGRPRKLLYFPATGKAFVRRLAEGEEHGHA